MVRSYERDCADVFFRAEKFLPEEVLMGMGVLLELIVVVETGAGVVCDGLARANEDGASSRLANMDEPSAGA